MAPDQLASGFLIISHPTPENDIYSLGMLCWFMISQQEPFGIPSDQIPSYVLDKNLRPSIAESTNKKLALLIRECWQRNEKQRPTVAKIEKVINESGIIF